MRITKRFTALLLSILMLFSLCGCTLPELLYSDVDIVSAFNPDADRRSGIIPFERMEYARPDVEKLREKADSAEDALHSVFSIKELIPRLNEFFTLYNDFNTMLTLAYIRSDIDASDNYYAKEYAFCSRAEGEVDRIYDDLLLACSNSVLCHFLDTRYFFGLLAEDYSLTDGSGYTPSDKLVSLYRTEAELENKYNTLYAKLVSDNDLESYKKLNEDMGKLYVKLINTRREIADMRNCDSYEEYAYLSYGRGYTADDLQEYRDAIRKYLVPIYKKAHEMGMLRRLDEKGDIAAQKAFDTVTDTVRGLDARIDEALDFMLEYKLYDISCSENKYTQSYVAYIDNYDAPFLFSAPSGFYNDVMSDAHELGHYIDSYINFSDNLSLDSEEMFSQGMEYLLLCNLDDTALSEMLTNYKMIDALNLYINQACFSEFEQRAFELSENELTVTKLNSIYGELAEEYGFKDAYGENVGLLWISVPHLFNSPYYVMSYCVSDSAAFNLYNMELREKGSGLSMYMDLLEGADELSFLELLESRNMASPITAETVQTIADTLSANLKI